MKQLCMTSWLILALCARSVAAEEVKSSGNDEATVRSAGEAYVKAFNESDAAAVASFWSPEAVYTNRLTGEQVVGREAIAEQFEIIFQATESMKLAVDVESIQFVSPNVAVEHGMAKFLHAEGEPEEVSYSAVYVRSDNRWLLDRVTDEPTPNVESNYEPLKELEWMIGDWVDESENARIVTECRWTKNKNFITRSFAVSIDDRIDMSGMQIVGWDPVAKQIRSWTFDSQGGFAEGKWSRQGERWYIHKTGVLPDGSRAGAVNIITRIDDDTITFQSIHRILDGQLQPNIDEVIVVRQPSAE